jgi:hypothetical protein
MLINYLKKNKIWSENNELFEFGEKKKKEKINHLLSSSLIEDFIINPKEIHNINIDAKSAKIWGTNMQRAIDDGNLLHEIMSNIKSISDLEKVIQEFYENGTLDLKTKEKYRNLITNILEHKELKQYYSAGLKSYNEREIIIKNSEPIRADRIVFSTAKEICIIDYKTGKLKKEDYEQLNSYEDILVDMGYKVKNKILINTVGKVNVVSF